MQPAMQRFEVLFDRSEPSSMTDPAFSYYGRLEFPEPPPDRPWIYANFVQSLDGVVSYKGRHAAGADISESLEDRWLMDMLRAHADAVILGVNTLMDETRQGTRPRGPIFRIVEPELRALRNHLGRGREMNIFVTSGARLTLSEYRVFDGEHVDAVILTTSRGAARLEGQKTQPNVRILVCGDGDFVPLDQAMQLLRRELNIRYLLCEGGPTLYGWLLRSGLVDEKFITVAPVEIGVAIPPEQEPSAAESHGSPKYRPTILDATGFLKETAPHWEWLSCRRVRNHQFSRYRRVRDPGAGAI